MGHIVNLYAFLNKKETEIVSFKRNIQVTMNLTRKEKIYGMRVQV